MDYDDGRTMNTCAFLLILTVQIYADGIEGPTGKTRARVRVRAPGAVGKFPPRVDETPPRAKSAGSLVQVTTS